MKHNGYHTATEQESPQDRAYPSAAQIVAERFPNYGDVFCEFHCKSLPFEKGSWGMIEAEEATDVAWEILDNMEE